MGITRGQIDKMTAAFKVDYDAMVEHLTAITRRTGGVFGDATGLDPINLDGLGVKVGDWVVAYGHGRYRIARVWNITPTKLSAVYVTPSEVETAARHGRQAYPQNITAKIADSYLYALDGDSSVTVR